MHPKSPKWLDDIKLAGANIAGWTAGLTLANYEADDLFQSAVECNFEIVGEAMLRIERTDPATAARISGHRRIIGFRNRIAHGYDEIDNAQVRDIIQLLLPALKVDVDRPLQEAGNEP